MRVRRVVVYIIPLSIIFSGEIARQESAYLQIPVLSFFFIRFHYFPFFTTTATTAFFPLERVNVILHFPFFRAVTTALLLITATSAFDVFIRHKSKICLETQSSRTIPVAATIIIGARIQVAGIYILRAPFISHIPVTLSLLYPALCLYYRIY